MTPHDVKVMDKLASTKDVHLQQLSSAQKLTKAVVLGLPPQIPEDDLTRLCNIASAEKLKKEKATQQGPFSAPFLELFQNMLILDLLASTGLDPTFQSP